MGYMTRPYEPVSVAIATPPGITQDGNLDVREAPKLLDISIVFVITWPPRELLTLIPPPRLGSGRNVFSITDRIRSPVFALWLSLQSLARVQPG